MDAVAAADRPISLSWEMAGLRGRQQLGGPLPARSSRSGPPASAQSCGVVSGPDTVNGRGRTGTAS